MKISELDYLIDTIHDIVGLYCVDDQLKYARDCAKKALELIREEKSQDSIVESESLINTIVDEVNRTIKDQLLELIGEKESQDPIVESVVSKLRSRSNVGIKKYGKTLADNSLPLPEWFNHIQEELMDAINYIEKIQQELGGEIDDRDL